MAKLKSDTLLRKVQKGGFKGKVNQGVSDMMSKFNFGGDNSRIQIFKKREIVQPYLHPIDSRLVNDQIERTVKNNLRGIDPKIDENYSKLMPSHLVNDLYSLYYNSNDRMKFEGLDKTNEFKFGILDSINNSLLKIVTNNSHIGSYVYTEAIGQFLYKKFMELPPEQQKKLKDNLNNCNQGGGGGAGKPPPGGKPKPKPKPNPNQGQNPNNQPQQPGGGGQPQPGNPDGDEEEGQSSKPPDWDLDERHEGDGATDGSSVRNEDHNNRGAANNSGKSGQKPVDDYSQEEIGRA